MIYSIFCTLNGKTISTISGDYADDEAAIEKARFYQRSSAADTIRVHRDAPFYPLGELVAELKAEPGNDFDMRCPKCGDTSQIDIAATVWVRLTSDGTDADEAADGGHFWDDDSRACCAACDHQATVKEFQPEATA
ncbi:MAG: hypothetical protein WB611_09965 [Stellaceae bacterium]